MLSIKNSLVQKIKVEKMRMLRQTSKSGRIRNEEIRDEVVVASAVDKMKEARLRWLACEEDNAQMSQ